MSDAIQDDGRAMPEVGRWAKAKYHFLASFLAIFSKGMRHKWPNRNYIDLFASAGLARIRGSTEIVRTSPLIAATTEVPLTRLHFCERDPVLADALRHRLADIGRLDACRVLCGDANECIGDLLSDLPGRDSLNAAFADPFGLHLNFETVRAIADHNRRCDLIILLADNMDALRNWATYYLQNPDSNLDRFMGEDGWRDVLDSSRSDRRAEKLRTRYFERLRDVGYSHFDSVRIENSAGRDIYSLVFASKHERGLDFWKKATAKDAHGQRSFDF